MSSGEWVDSLERAVEICRDQVALARATGVGQYIAVPVDDLEKILDALNESTKND